MEPNEETHQQGRLVLAFVIPGAGAVVAEGDGEDLVV